MTRKHVLSVIGLLLALIMATGTDDTGTQSGGGSGTVDLHAAVSFSGAQFVISNNDDFDWTEVKLEVNSHGFTSGYTLHATRIAALETYTVGAMQFANSDGERFNPFTHKPQTFSVWCDTPNGKGSYYGGWNE